MLFPQGSRKRSDPVRRYRHACLAERLPQGFLVVDHEAEVAGSVRRLCAWLAECDELVAEVDPRHSAPPAAKLEHEESRPPLQGGVHAVDLECDVVYPERPHALAPLGLIVIVHGTKDTRRAKVVMRARMHR